MYEVENFVNYDVTNGQVINDGNTLIDISDTDNSFVKEKSRKLHYLYLQDVWSVNESLELTAGIRADKYSDFSINLTPRMAAVWSINDKFSTKILYGQAYRAPSFVEIDNTQSSDLHAEESETSELEISYKPNQQLLLKANLFYYDMKEIIKWSSGEYKNGGEFSVKGLEIESLWEITDDVRLNANITLRKPEENANRNDYEPYQDAFLGINWRVNNKINFSTQMNWLGKRKRSDRNSNTDNKIAGTSYDNLVRPDLDEHMLVDATLNYQITKKWLFAFTINNLFDKEAKESTGRTIPYDLPLAERNFSLRTQYKF